MALEIVRKKEDRLEQDTITNKATIIRITTSEEVAVVEEEEDIIHHIPQIIASPSLLEIITTTITTMQLLLAISNMTVDAIRHLRIQMTPRYLALVEITTEATITTILVDSTMLLVEIVEKTRITPPLLRIITIITIKRTATIPTHTTINLTPLDPIMVTTPTLLRITTAMEIIMQEMHHQLLPAKQTRATDHHLRYQTVLPNLDNIVSVRSE